FADEIHVVEDENFVIERHTLTQTLIEELPAEIQEGKKRAVWSGIPLSPFRSITLSAFVLIAIVGGLTLWRYQNSHAKASAPAIKSLAVLPFQTLAADSDNAPQGLGLADLLITRLSSLKDLTVRPTSAILPYDKHPSDSARSGQQLQ